MDNKILDIDAMILQTKRMLDDLDSKKLFALRVLESLEERRKAYGEDHSIKRTRDQELFDEQLGDL